MLTMIRSSSYGRRYVALPSFVCRRQTKPGRAVGERVDLVQPLDEAAHDRTVQGTHHPADVELGEVELVHGGKI